jgi:type IV pilus biogenesis protein CpaD/CtpE
MLRSLICALGASLVACSSQGPIVPAEHLVTQTVEVAVPVPCVAAVPRPDVAFLTRDQILSGSGGQVLRKFDGELAKHEAYELDLVAALTGCTAGQNPAPQPAPLK